MKDRKIILFLLVGILFILIGFILGGLKEHNSDLHLDLKKAKISTPVSSPPSTSQVLSNHASDTTKREVLIVEVLDGDSVQASNGETIRYIGVNAPEKGEPFFEEASRLNKNLALGKKAVLELDVDKTDRYGRTLAYVFVSDKLLNLEMVKNGLAVTQTIQPNVKYQDEIVGAQRTARENCLGLWKELCSQNSSSCINIASIYQDAPGNDNQNKNGEWVEIKNVCTSSVSMEGWLLKDSSASNRYKFKNFSLDGGTTVFIYSGCGQDSIDKLYWQCPEGKYAIWNNSGDHGFLYNEEGILKADYQY